MENKEHYRNLENIALATFGLVGIALISFGAFSKKTRKEILRRDGYRSVLSGSTENLEAAHINHNRDLPTYDDASNGRTLTTEEHYWDHVNRHGTANLGLNNAQNEWAIAQLFKRAFGISNNSEDDD